MAEALFFDNASAVFVRLRLNKTAPRGERIWSGKRRLRPKAYKGTARVQQTAVEQKL